MFNFAYDMSLVLKASIGITEVEGREGEEMVKFL